MTIIPYVKDHVKRLAPGSTPLCNFSCWPLAITEALSDRPWGSRCSSHTRRPAQPLQRSLWRELPSRTGTLLVVTLSQVFTFLALMPSFLVIRLRPGAEVFFFRRADSPSWEGGEILTDTFPHSDSVPSTSPLLALSPHALLHPRLVQLRSLWVRAPSAVRWPRHLHTCLTLQE